MLNVLKSVQELEAQVGMLEIKGNEHLSNVSLCLSPPQGKE